MNLQGYIIKTTGDHVTIYDSDGNFLQSNDTRSEALADIREGLVGSPEKIDYSDHYDPRKSGDLAWDGYDL